MPMGGGRYLDNNDVNELGIVGVACHHSGVSDGFAYVAIKGSIHDGNSFIPHAIHNGASVVFTDDEKVMSQTGGLIHSDDSKIKVVYVRDAKLALSFLARHFYNNVQFDNLVAITGTNGKTSTAFFYGQLVAALGIRCATLGTLGKVLYKYDSSDSNGDVHRSVAYDVIPHDGSNLTTPDAIVLHKEMRKLWEDNYRNAAIEVTSHALEYKRVDHIEFGVAAFTNISQDHLDYHKTMDKYFAAKQRLFSEVLVPGSVAVLNADDTSYGVLHDIADKRGLRIVDYGVDGSVAKISPDFSSVSILGKEYKLPSESMPSFQLYNIVCALSIIIAGQGRSVDRHAALHLVTAPGRLQEVALYRGRAKVYLDFAHTPAALSNALLALSQKRASAGSKGSSSGKLHVVFGCGGDRDRSKRPIMGEIASSIADYVVITDDNPRTEDRASIRSEIIAGCSGGADITEIADRAEAIRYAIAQLEPDDVLLIAGKGHENSQIIGTTRVEFSDHDEICKFIYEEDSKQ